MNRKYKLKNKHKKIIIIAIIVLGIIALTTFIACIVLTPKLYLTSNKDMTIEINKGYTEPGYKSYVLNKDITNNVEVSNNINPKKIGSYQVNYKIKYLIFDVKKTRTVKVIDSKPPTLKLIGSKEVRLCPNDSYKEEGYEAFDNYDGNLTKKVITNLEKDKINYIVEDTFGNRTVKTRELIREDKETPIIKLNGYNYMNLYLNSTFRDPGYEALDNCDGNLTSKVEVSGSVDTSKIGIYKITYKVSDSSGNVTAVERTINVMVNNTTTNSVIYLTFDDGPSKTVTSQILDILKSEDIKATFFVINHDDSLNYLIKREYDEGHTVGLHSYTHNYQTIYSSNNAYIDDLEKMSNKVKNIIGINSKIIRFPGGSSNTISKRYTSGVMSYLASEVGKKGYKYYDWNISSEDAGGVHSSNEVYNNVINNLKHNRVNMVLMHDFENNYYTLNALRAIIKYGKSNGYQFSNITLDTPQIVHRINN